MERFDIGNHVQLLHSIKCNGMYRYNRSEDELNGLLTRMKEIMRSGNVRDIVACVMDAV